MVPLRWVKTEKAGDVRVFGVDIDTGVVAGGVGEEG